MAGLIAVQPGNGQVARKEKRRSLRALGLVALAPDGKARLIPVAIMVNGEFFDASVYKAAPVPMALYSETVYEAFKTGVSQGLFTVEGALSGPNNSWTGVGKWRSAEAIAASEKNSKKVIASTPRDLEVNDSPPVLRHSGVSNPKPPEPASSTAPPAAAPVPAPATAAQNTAPAQSDTPHADTKANAEKPSAGEAASPSAATASATAPDSDPDAPVLHRGKPAQAPTPEPLPKLSATARPMPDKTLSAKAGSSNLPASPAPKILVLPDPNIQLIPAVSDAMPTRDARSYAFSMAAPAEEQLRKKMLDLAADAIRARALQASGGTPAGSESKSSSGSPHIRSAGKAGKPVQPDFQDVQLRIFDLTNTNDAVLVLTTTAQMPPQRSSANANPDLRYFVTCVARQDVNGDLHKSLVNVTDSDHLDAIPRLVLIDAVDADGDGRGELLFQQVSDVGSAYVIYRVIGDQLYPLFRGKPS